MGFPYWLVKHDPNSEADYSTPEFALNSGEQMVGVTVLVVDDFDNEITDTNLTIYNITWGSVGTNLWQVTFWVRGGTPGAIYLIRFRMTTDSIPRRVFDRTRRLRVKHT